MKKFPGIMMVSVLGMILGFSNDNNGSAGNRNHKASLEHHLHELLAAVVIQKKNLQPVLAPFEKR